MYVCMYVCMYVLRQFKQETDKFYGNSLVATHVSGLNAKDMQHTIPNDI